MNRLEFIDVVGRLRRHVASAGHYGKRAVFRASRDRLPFFEPSFNGPVVFAANRPRGAGLVPCGNSDEQLLLGRYVNHSYCWDARFDQGNVHREFTVALDEFLGTVNGIDNPKPRPCGTFGIRD